MKTLLKECVTINVKGNAYLFLSTTKCLADEYWIWFDDTLYCQVIDEQKTPHCHFKQPLFHCMNGIFHHVNECDGFVFRNNVDDGWCYWFIFVVILETVFWWKDCQFIVCIDDVIVSPKYFREILISVSYIIFLSFEVFNSLFNFISATKHIVPLVVSITLSKSTFNIKMWSVYSMYFCIFFYFLNCFVI